MCTPRQCWVYWTINFVFKSIKKIINHDRYVIQNKELWINIWPRAMYVSCPALSAWPWRKHRWQYACHGFLYSKDWGTWVWSNFELLGLMGLNHWWICWMRSNWWCSWWARLWTHRYSVTEEDITVEGNGTCSWGAIGDTDDGLSLEVDEDWWLLVLFIGDAVNG